MTSKVSGLRAISLFESTHGALDEALTCGLYINLNAQHIETLDTCGLRASSWPESILMALVMRHAHAAYH